MENSKIWKEISRLKKQLKRKRSRSTSDNTSTRSESPRSHDHSQYTRKKSPPRRRRRIISSDEEDSSINEANQAVETSQDDLFAILGDDPTLDNEFSDEIHSHMAVRWNNILQRGLKKDTRSDLIKRYLPPANCTYLKSPKLNDQIKAAVQESSIKRDSKLESKQTQLGAGITCIGRALDAVLKISDKALREEIIKHLGDAGQILTDLHYLESNTRRSLLSQSLNKNTKDAIMDIPRDHFLFGEGLAEKLKAIKACSKSAADIKTKPPRPQPGRIRNIPKANTGPATSLNWRGSSRRAAAVNTYNNTSASAYRERRPVAAPAHPRRAQTSQRPPQAKRT